MSNQGPIIAVIVARAGSRGVPGKNTALVGGRPCIAWTIDAVQQCPSVNDVVVTTDDQTARQLAASMGVEVVDRPGELATDSARVDDAVRHCVERYELHHGEVRAVVILYANVPIRPEGLIERAVTLFSHGHCDSVQSYSPVGKHHPWWTARIEEDQTVAAWEDGAILNHGVYRRQDLPAAFIPDGGVLIVSREALLERIPGVARGPHCFFGKVRKGIINPEGSVVDIDTPIDLIVADTLLRKASRAVAA
ncbi:MAG: acylneuraminate cytidylyltransferase family protein [Planctomycetota bacterium]|nr:acylneuraminate cytidylyltransferase family protein [Planctomycetota bacterium]